MGWDSCPCSFQSYACCRVPTSWAARTLLRAEPTPTRTHLKTSLRGGQGGRPLPSRSLTSFLPSWSGARAQNFSSFFLTPFFPELFSSLPPPGPLSPFPPPLFPIVLLSPSSRPLISISCPSSPTSLLSCPPPHL